MSAPTDSRVEGMTTTAFTVICPTGNVVEMPDADAVRRYVEWGHTCADARFHAVVQPGTDQHEVEAERRRTMDRWEFR